MTQSKLVALSDARRMLIPCRPDGKPINPSTVWRWIKKGLDALDGERIKLEVIYVGRTPHVSPEMVKEFFDKVTAAKKERIRQQELATAEVTTEELKASGLVGQSR